MVPRLTHKQGGRARSVWSVGECGGCLLAVSVCLGVLAAGLLLVGSQPAFAERADGAVEEKPAPGTATAKGRPQSRQRRVGSLIRISAPITERVVNRVRRIADTAISAAKQKGEWPVLIFEIHPGRSEIGQAWDLARFISSSRMNGATTVAYLPETVTGHAVLVAVACDQIVMAEDARIGNASQFEPDPNFIEPSMRNAYVEIANRRKTIPADLALKMLDPSLEVLEVETEVSREYVLSSRLKNLEKKKTVAKKKVRFPAGEPGLFSGGEGRELGFVSYLAADRSAVAKALGLPSEAVEEDISLAGDLRPVRIDLKGPIGGEMTNQVQNLIQNQVRDNDVNFICLWIDSPGGSPTDSINLAAYLTGLDPSQRHTVAYIPQEARADAAFVALACDHIVMHPAAILGGSGAYQITDADIEPTAKSLRGIAERKNRSQALAAAMVDPNLTVYRYTRGDGLVDYFSEADVVALADANQWHRGEAVTHAGQPLRLDGDKAAEYGLARDLVPDFAAFKALYGLEDEPALVEPGWADFLIDALNSPGIAWLLLLLGGAALYAELQSPGIGLGGLIAAICFLLYFWSAYLGGTAGWLEVLLFLAGVASLLLEIFVLPGFGLFGLAGGLLILCSLILASQTFVLPRNDYQLEQLRNTLFVLTGAGLGAVVAAALIRRYLPHTPMLNRMLLAPPSGEELSIISRREALARLEHLAGSQGVAFTPLVPGGKARFGDQLVDVLADGDFIDRGSAVEVIEVRGNRVVVRAVS